MLARADALYARFEVTDPEPALVRAGLGRRDSGDSDDGVALYVDPAGDGRRAYVFRVNPLGVQGDALHLPGSAFDEDDDAWDAVWRSAGRRTPTGYEVELAVPWAALRVSAKVDHVGLWRPARWRVGGSPMRGRRWTRTRTCSWRRRG